MAQQEYENKIKELEQQVKELKSVKVAEKGGRWKPSAGSNYYNVHSSGIVIKFTFYGEDYDEWSYLTGNCFKTEEEAEEYKKQIEYTARYKNYVKKHSKPLNWHDNEQPKYFALFEHEENKIEIDYYNIWKFQGTIYASSRQIIEDAIKEIGEENFKKYVLGVK